MGQVVGGPMIFWKLPDPYKNQAHAARRIVRVSQESERFQGCFDSLSFIW